MTERTDERKKAMKDKTLTMEMCEKQLKIWNIVKHGLSAVSAIMNLFLSGVLLLLVAGGDTELIPAVLFMSLIHAAFSYSAERDTIMNIANIKQNIVLLIAAETEGSSGDRQQ